MFEREQILNPIVVGVEAYATVEGKVRGGIFIGVREEGEEEITGSTILTTVIADTPDEVLHRVYKIAKEAFGFCADTGLYYTNATTPPTQIKIAAGEQPSKVLPANPDNTDILAYIWHNKLTPVAGNSTLH